MVAACHGGAGVVVAPHTEIPARSVADAADEWLYDHCEVKKIVRLGADQLQAAAQAAGATFVEILYADPDAIDVVMFGCGTPPPADLVGAL
jgi:hypothetical protein